MKIEELAVLQVASKMDNMYLNELEYSIEHFVEDGKKVDFFALYKIDEITFEDEAPRKEALENVISSMNIPGVNFIYIIKGDNKGISFYYGVARDFQEAPLMAIYDIGTSILKPNLHGNFRGSKITELDANEKTKFLSEIDEMRKIKIIEGVPGINKDDENFQSVDRIVDVMMGNEFALMIIAKPLSQDEILRIQDKMYEVYDAIIPFSKSSVQGSSGINEGSSVSDTQSDSETTGTNKSNTWQASRGNSWSNATGTNYGTSQSTSRQTSEQDNGNSRKSTSSSGQEGSSKGGSETETVGRSTNESNSKTEGKSISETKGTSKSTSASKGFNLSSSTTHEIVNKKVQEWIKYIDDIILPRIDYGIGKGLFLSSAVLLGNNEADLIKLENTIRSIYGGESGNRMPFKAFHLNKVQEKYVKRMQSPIVKLDKALSDGERGLRLGYSQIVEEDGTVKLGSWMSSKELSLFAGLPQKEVVGLALREEVDFGLNVGSLPKEPVLLGHLIQSGIVLNGEHGTPNIEVNFEKEYFDKHIFVTGVTGSGKTTTCQKLLLEGQESFMVIEPAKTEYRVLKTKFPDLLVFTLGKETAAPFRLNPFEFFRGESITSRVDMIKASMEATFDMEAAIPQILETAMYQCYEDKGWNISTNENSRFKDPFLGKEFAFPTLSDLDKKIEEVVIQQGFDDRLKNDYIGSIRARLKGLMVGAKGLMLNTPRSINFVDLLGKKVVLELENIKSASEKSLLMGFILSNLSEAIKEKYSKTNKPINHITLIEEAHRLLSKYTPGDSMNKKQGVEMFSDLLAEVRKYGEALIIADQIPNKLTPEVLKNTNTKIVHKIFAQDDKEAIGNTMALKEEQKEHLSYLEPGSAIMMNPGLNKAIQLKIMQTSDNDTKRVPPKDDELRESCLMFYASVHKEGILPGLERLKKEPSLKQMKIYFNYLLPDSEFVKNYKNMVRFHKVDGQLWETLRDIVDENGLDTIVELIQSSIYDLNHISMDVDFYKILKAFISELLKQGSEMNIASFKEIDYLELIKE